jgi:hypothetical protein
MPRAFVAVLITKGNPGPAQQWRAEQMRRPGRGPNIELVSEYPDTLASMPGGPVLVMLVPTAWTELCEPLPA